MLTSGLLVTLTATALEMPVANVSTALKALRADRQISIKGRGRNAAEMSPIDAATLLTGISTGAVTADIPKITRLLLKMRLKHQFVSGSSLARLISTPLQELKSDHAFKDGFAALLEESLQPYEDELGDRTRTDPLNRRSQVLIAVNGNKTRGLGVIETNVRSNRYKYFYSNLTLRNGISENEDFCGLGFELLEEPPTFMTATVINGPALVQITEAIAANQ